MSMGDISPIVLVILDGWGYREEKDGNAIAAATTPVMDSLWAAYPRTLIEASGKDVGLPKGQMGNSEVGHLNIGAGRIVPQELVRISDALEDRSIMTNEALLKTFAAVREAGSKLHLIGLCSDGGVHSHIDHLIGLLEMAKAESMHDVCIHVITDGRDTLPNSGVSYVHKLQQQIDRIGVGRIVTVSGRYYVMDRDRRWDRVQKAYEILTSNDLIDARSAIDLLETAYTQEVTDEFIPPTRIAPGAIESGDGIICFNFRPDRSREIAQAFMSPSFNGFDRSQITPLHYTTFTQYDPSLPLAVAFLPQNLDNMLGKVIADHGLKQLRAAETEKYAHVTYFFDGGQEEPSTGDERILVNSPMVSTYDQAPAMSAQELTKVAIAAIDKHIYSLIVINYANPDMVGHTGNYDAAIKAISFVDKCLGELISSVNNAGGVAIVTADHGNAEQMWDEHHNPWTAHTTNPVPLIIVEGEVLKIPGHGGEVRLREHGRLADIAPTILDILQIPKPAEMTGESLLEASDYQVSKQRSPMKLRV